MDEKNISPHEKYFFYAIWIVRRNVKRISTAVAAISVQRSNRLRISRTLDREFFCKALTLGMLQ